MSRENRLPTAVWVEAHLRQFGVQGVSYYIVQKGAYDRGTLLLKINLMGGTCRLLTQQRDLDGKMIWINAMSDAQPAENKADEYMRRAISRDPDIWVIEVEDKEGANPFNENPD
ncbi:MAG: DUF1491 family protein [Alphaproteobacteria bacterium]